MGLWGEVNLKGAKMYLPIRNNYKNMGRNVDWMDK